MNFPLNRIFSLALLLVGITVLFPAKAQDARVPCQRFWHQIACVSVPLATPADDAQAKQFDAPSDAVAKIYLARSGTMAPLQKSDIFLDGKWIGTLAPLTYLVIETNPGTHTVNASDPKNGKHDSFSMQVEGYKNTYLQEQLYQLFNAEKITFKIVDQQTGQAAVLASKLISPATQPAASIDRPPSP
ncbi:DUF2846 domain-containing protein [Glaciimonas sp. PCH181]|uniref:DUF2846 domain-containing protein n=1 Tax=Glaciimonas sp. PCH181 TaxID=2133943 RepID=UPI001374A139|nr:DUF2846 domain-containing protein [Glaciimonas sp. PCH181]